MKKVLTCILLIAIVISCNSKYDWIEEFNGDSIDENIWSKIDEGPHDWNRHMSKDSDLFEIGNGFLILKGKISEDSIIRTGGVYSKTKKDFGYGRIDIKAKLEGAKGAWPALWLWPSENNDQRKFPYAEIDICERLNFDTIAYQTLHTAYNLKPEGDKYQKKGVTGKINPDDFNIYSVEHYKDSIKLYINDSLTNTYKRMEIAPDGQQLPADEQWPFDQRFYLILDMQIAGKWVGEPDIKDYPISMTIDWIKYTEFKNEK